MFAAVRPLAQEAPFPLAVTQITLCAFRSYADVRLELAPTPAVFTGPNGSGKTNLLEAISLLVPGRGLRRASLATLQNRTMPDRTWGVATEVQTPLGLIPINTARDPSAKETDRRLVQIDGQMAKSQQALADHMAITWITPDMDRTLSEGPSARRRLLDRLVYGFDPAHAGRVVRYEKAMRERLFLLREGTGDSAWLSALENTMAQTGTAIAAARWEMARQLGLSMNEVTGAFPQALIDLAGTAEALLSEAPALVVEDRLRALWHQSRGSDSRQGTTEIGPHRSDLLVVHQGTGCPADLCSTGEQKALVISVMLAYVRAVIRARGLLPIFLLDDIAAHLDETRRNALFDEICALGVQAFLTGTDRESFGPFLKTAQHFAVRDGQVEG